MAERIPDRGLTRLSADIYDAALRFRRELLAQERAASSELAQRYGQVWRQAQVQLDALLARLQAERAAAEAAGRPFSPSGFQIYEQQRLRALRDQVEREVARLTVYADAETQRLQAEMVEAAQRHAAEYVQMQLDELLPGQATVRFGRLDPEAFTDLVGFLQNGSPLRALLAELPGQAGQALLDALVVGMGLGQNPRQIARLARQALGGNLARLLTIARTETLRAYREAARRSYQANADVVTGWVWVAAQDSRTCAACWAMHGTVHNLNERMADHPNGRCSPAPVTRSWAELRGQAGAPETGDVLASGSTLFERLPEAEQAAILGPAAHAAYRDGRVTLADFVGLRDSTRWGPTHYRRSLREILGAEEARQYVVGGGRGTTEARRARSGDGD